MTKLLLVAALVLGLALLAPPASAGDATVCHRPEGGLLEICRNQASRPGMLDGWISVEVAGVGPVKVPMPV